MIFRHIFNSDVIITSLKVSESRNKKLEFSILPKNERNTQKMSWELFQVFRSFFGRIYNSKNCFRNLLTFRNLRLRLNLPRIDMAIPITMSKAPMVTALHACHKQVDVTWPSALNVENKGLAEGPLSPCPITVNQNWKFHPKIIQRKPKLFWRR